ncbi:CRISPR-associated endonuclease Cas6 [Emticicia sp. 17c]|uniref:CRISPR-associated endonuclease Cas6 n=1 Tax=Emticicia sp. 17c TaxID=3127704 RepID=UPI003FA54DCD
MTVGLFLESQERIIAQINVSEHETQLKNKIMLAFAGEFTTNALLPDGVGIGKSPSRGFGTIKKSTNHDDTTRFTKYYSRSQTTSHSVG